MGYIPKSSKVTLNAYLTQKGREYFIKGTEQQVEIKYFSLNDPDVNYRIASRINGDGDKNVLPSGFIPDLTGDNTGCIKSVASGLEQKYTIKGGSNLIDTKTFIYPTVTVSFTDGDGRINFTFNKNTTGNEKITISGLQNYNSTLNNGVLTNVVFGTSSNNSQQNSKIKYPYNFSTLISGNLYKTITFSFLNTITAGETISFIFPYTYFIFDNINPDPIEFNNYEFAIKVDSLENLVLSNNNKLISTQTYFTN